MTHASPPNCQAGTFSDDMLPNGPAFGRPESGGRDRVSRRIKLGSRVLIEQKQVAVIRAQRPIRSYGTISKGRKPAGHVAGESGSDRSEGRQIAVGCQNPPGATPGQAEEKGRRGRQVIEREAMKRPHGERKKHSFTVFFAQGVPHFFTYRGAVKDIPALRICRATGREGRL